ncbi:hypothetical protein [Serratia marcescens]|uniref:hypothetical protein n=1 Tax=Serratia marcescens TaxID=615 RepID=UPI000CDB2ACE|nr:hypothetical protein [Serratia marcescens]POP21835.1 hypothetical protein C3R39_10715 [Serratia marcescens]POP25509.1 hypothetical protein C3R43_15945 [Serratia marcescens]WLS86883.1 hypothetical protein RAM09_18780 [Serratia marcescens]
MMAIDNLKADNTALRDQRAGLAREANRLETHNARLREWNAGLAQESCELQAKLATPVQLQNCDFGSVAIMAHWCTDEQLKAWVKGVEHAKKQIRAAGFTVEGDE